MRMRRARTGKTVLKALVPLPEFGIAVGDFVTVAPQNPTHPLLLTRMLDVALVEALIDDRRFEEKLYVPPVQTEAAPASPILQLVR